MEIRIVPYTEPLASAAGSFNRRMREHNQTEYLLGETAPVTESEEAPIRNAPYLAVEGDAVRGGFLLASFPAFLAGEEGVEVLNCREPVSEAIIDRKYSFLALQMLKFMDRKGPYLFALGMGSQERPFPRLLKGAGWTVYPVPFLFRVVRARPFLENLQRLQQPPLLAATARIAARSGAGSMATGLAQARPFSGLTGLKGLTLHQVSAWDEWADQLWEQFRLLCSFTVTRDRRTLNALYPPGDRIRIYLMRRGGQPAGWVTALHTSMRGHRHFGNMRVGTILDAVAAPGEMRAAATLAMRALAADGADLLVTNQSHELWVRAFRKAGFLGAASNYILALSKRLAARIAEQPGGHTTVHLTRGDSDGRIFL
jgi:hypothetical protein